MLFALLALSINSVNAQVVSDQQNNNAFANIVYKTTSSGNPIDLDIYLPANSGLSKHPVVIIIHGGSWIEGDKSLEDVYYMQRLKSELHKNGFAVISINYSLVNKDVHLPTPIEDCKDAVRWARAHADEYNLDTANIGLWGGSAGGHLALMSAYTSDDTFVGDKELSIHSAKVNFVIDLFGPTDLNKLFKIDLGGFATTMARIFYPKLYTFREDLVYYLTGYSVKENRQKVREINSFYSPIHYADKNAVPTIIFHGTKDKTVDLSQSEALKKALDHFFIDNALIIVENGDHGFTNIAKDELDKSIEQSIVFIKKYIK